MAGAAVYVTRDHRMQRSKFRLEASKRTVVPRYLKAPKRLTVNC